MKVLLADYVFHPHQGGELCFGVGVVRFDSFWNDCAQPRHGRIVTCNSCGRMGYAAEDGFLNYWLQLLRLTFAGS